MPLGWKPFKTRNASVPDFRELGLAAEKPSRISDSNLDSQPQAVRRAPRYDALRGIYRDLDSTSASPTRQETRTSSSNRREYARPQHFLSRSYDVPPYSSPLHKRQVENAYTRIGIHIMTETREDPPPRASNEMRRYDAPAPLPPAPSTPSHSPQLGKLHKIPSNKNLPSMDSSDRSSAAGGATPRGRPRQSSGTSINSGSSAYTGYIEGVPPSSPSSTSHYPPLPPPPNTKSSVTPLGMNEVPLARTRSNDPSTPPATNPVEQRKRTYSSPFAMDAAQNRSPRSRPQPNLPSNIVTPKYQPAFTPPVPGAHPSSPTRMNMPVPANGAYPSPTTASNSNFFMSSPPPMSVQFPMQSPEPGPSQQTEFRGVSYAPEPPKPYGRPSLDGLATIAPPPRRQTRKQTIAIAHACLTLHRTDKIRLIKFPPSAVQAVKAAIERSWPRGLQGEKDVPGSIDFQLRGNPWSQQGDEGVLSVYMVTEIMSSLYHLGWSLTMSTDISKRAMDKDTLIYRQGEIPSPKTFMAVSFNEGDRLRLIKAPNDVINAVKAVWGGNIQRESWKLENVAWEFKLAGNPWWSSGDEGINLRILLLNMLDVLAQLGWEMHTSVDLTAGPGGLGKNAGADTDCWILRKSSN